LKTSLFISLILAVTSATIAQTDSTGTPKKPINKSFLDASTDVGKDHSPKKAAVLSSCAPFLGLGQIYNKKYWKLPIVYGVSAYLIYTIHSNNILYQDYRDELYRRDITAAYPEIQFTQKDFPSISTETIHTRKDIARNKRDKLILLTGGFYAFTIIDAYVDAHLINFHIDKKKMMTLRPSLVPSYKTASLGFNFKCTF
jgi:hypothetical protein